MSIHEVIDEIFDAVFNQQQAAYYLGVSTSLLKKLRLIGEGPSYYKISNRVTYRKEDLDDYLTKCRIETTGKQTRSRINKQAAH